MEKILELTIDSNLDFSDRISNICKTANKKANAKFRVWTGLDSDECSSDELSSTIFPIDCLSEKILGITLDNNLDFSDPISNICKTANQKLNALFRVSAGMNSDHCSLMVKSFIKSHLRYFLLIWMFCNRKIMKKINKIQEHYLHYFGNAIRCSTRQLWVDYLRFE